MTYTDEQITKATERMQLLIEAHKDTPSPAQQARVADLKAGLDDVPAFLDAHPDYANPA